MELNMYLHSGCKLDHTNKKDVAALCRALHTPKYLKSMCHMARRTRGHATLMRVGVGVRGTLRLPYPTPTKAHSYVRM